MKSEDIYILEAVNEADFRATCATPNSPSLRSFQNGLSGHTYALVNLPRLGWRLIDTNYSLYSKENGDGEGTPFPSPDEIEKAEEPLKIPDGANPYQSMYGNLYTFSVQRIDRVSYFKLAQRQNVVASGNKEESKCRKTLSAGSGFGPTERPADRPNPATR